MIPYLSDVIEQAAGLSKNGGVQITVRANGGTTVHFINPNSGNLEKTKASTVRIAVEKAIDEMMLTPRKFEEPE